MTQVESKLGMVTVVVFDGNDQGRSTKTVLSMDRSKVPPWHWNFPCGLVHPEDVDPNHPFDDFTAAGNAVKRIVKKRTGLEVQARVIQVKWRPNPQGKLYLFVGVADFNKLVPPTGEMVVQVFSVDEVKKIDYLFPSHHIAFVRVLKWMRGIKK